MRLKHKYYWVPNVRSRMCHVENKLILLLMKTPTLHQYLMPRLVVLCCRLSSPYYRSILGCFLVLCVVLLCECSGMKLVWVVRGFFSLRSTFWSESGDGTTEVESKPEKMSKKWQLHRIHEWIFFQMILVIKWNIIFFGFKYQLVNVLFLLKNHS